MLLWKHERGAARGLVSTTYHHPTTYNLQPTTYHLQPYSVVASVGRGAGRRRHPPPQPRDVALLPCHQEHAGDEHGAVRSCRYTDRQHEQEVADAAATEQQQREDREITVSDVMNDRPIVCNRLWFTASGKLRIWPRATFSRIGRTPRSSHVPKPTTVSNPVMKNVFTSTSKDLAEDRERAHDQQRRRAAAQRSPTRRSGASSARCGTRR